MKKIKKPLHQRTFLIFIPLDNGKYFFPLDNGKFLPKKYAEKN